MKMKSIGGHSNSEGKKTPPVELSQWRWSRFGCPS